jgi:chemotaxis protein CheY-P-specific phosphatase CheC
VNELLNELEIDALTEIVNIGVGRAATSLRDMVGEQVMLSVPRVTTLTPAAATVVPPVNVRWSSTLSSVPARGQLIGSR